jgi:antitoxin component of RelBE/YafQ-DinJ toxin-antitoxin module
MTVIVDRVAMRITFRFDKQLIHDARKWAESHGTTLNDVIRDRLTKIANGEVTPHGAQSESLNDDVVSAAIRSPAKKPRTREPKLNS